MPKQLAKTDGFKTLVSKISREISELEVFVKRRTTETYWKIGKFIHEHLLENKQRADYGHFILERLGRDVDKDATSLARALQFYRTYPTLATWQELTWSHYRTLLSIKDTDERKKLEKQIISKGWDNRQLAGYLRKKRSAESSKDGPVPQLSFTHGRLNICKALEKEKAGKSFWIWGSGCAFFSLSGKKCASKTATLLK